MMDSVFGGISTTYDMVMVLIVLGIVVGIVAFFMWYLSHKHMVVIRYRMKDRKYIITDKAKEVTVQGVSYWKLLKMKKKVTVPPPGAIEITRKGKFMAECYWDADNPNPVWIYDTGVPDDALQPFTTKQRALLVNEFRQAELRKKKGLLETLEKLAVPFALVMILIVMLVFFENIAKPAQDMMAANERMMKSNEEITDNQARIMSFIANKADLGELDIEQTFKEEPPVTG